MYDLTIFEEEATLLPLGLDNEASPVFSLAGDLDDVAQSHLSQFALECHPIFLTWSSKKPSFVTHVKSTPAIHVADTLLKTRVTICFRVLITPIPSVATASQ